MATSWRTTPFRLLHPAIGLALVAFLNAASAQDIDTLRSAIVKIVAQGEGVRQIGTGFIVRLEPDIAYIATASHVVEDASNIQIEFFTQRNRSVEARILKREAGNPKGLAVLTVRGTLPAGIESIPGVARAETSANEAVLWVQGDVNLLLRAIAQTDVERFVFAEPQLEDIFFDFFTGGQQ